MKIPKRILSNIKKQILNSFTFLLAVEEFQYNIMQTGIRKPVNIIIDKDKPSTPKFILKLGKASHEIS
jgi:hypothetical protein